MLRYLPLIYLNHNRDRIASYIHSQWIVWKFPSWRAQGYPEKIRHFDMLHKCGFIDRAIENSIRPGP